jgi:glycosyltransferase involved in cell wall biosynthesis
MKNNLFIITNESIYCDKNDNFLCDNIDLKSIPEELNKFSQVTIIGRNSKKQRSKKINLKKINISKNIFSYLSSIHKSFKNENIEYLIVSLSPFTFLASILLKIFKKKHFIYLRSDGYEEYKSILGFLGPLIYHLMFKIGISRAQLISCRKHLLRDNKGTVVNPSQLNEKWFKEQININPNNVKLLYVGRLRIEKGIFSLLNMLKESNIELTIITAEKEDRLKENNQNIKLISFENYNDSIIKFYDEHSIFILPSFTEAHPQVVDEALARARPVIIFKDIEHVKRDREGIFVCKRDLQSLQETIQYINNNYEVIIGKIKKNKLPTKKNFINELKKIIFN